jgi:signal transduction histidine kinase
MAHGTSAHGESLSRLWADVGRNRASTEWPCAAGRFAGLNPLALGLALGLLGTVAWQAATDAAAGGPTAVQLAILIATGAAAALTGLRLRDRAVPARKDPGTPHETSQLLAQMHHELRTPLNAMIGFSDVMLLELHGPLGNARYQEYAAHISESGGRLLKASEDALAVAATMSALVSDRRVALRRERLPAGALLHDAWGASVTPGRSIRLRMDDCATAEVECDRQATSEALQHVLGEAIARTPPGAAVTARASVTSGACVIEITADAPKPTRDSPAPPVASNGLRLLLARSLIEMQGATLNLGTEPQADGWTARVAFPTRSDRPVRHRKLRAGVMIEKSAASRSAEW